MTDEEIQKRAEARRVDEKQHKLIDQFIDGLKNNDTQKAAENLTALKKIEINDYNNHILKECRLTEMLKFVANDTAQPFLKEYFDMAIKDGVGKWAGSANNLIQYTQHRLKSCIFDGNEDIVYFLRAYHIAKKERAAQGKDTFVPESFAYNSFLKDISEGIFRNERGRIIEKRDYEQDKVSVTTYYEDQYGETSQIEAKGVFEGKGIGVWGFHRGERTEFQHFTKDGKDDTQLELAREKARQRYLSNHYEHSEDGFGVATADEIAKRQISGEEKRTVTPKVGREIYQQVRSEMVKKRHENNK